MAENENDTKVSMSMDHVLRSQEQKPSTTVTGPGETSVGHEGDLNSAMPEDADFGADGEDLSVESLSDVEADVDADKNLAPSGARVENPSFDH